MDEHRIGLKPVQRRVWAPIGQRPVAVVQHRFAWRYVVGFVHPASGRTIFHLATSVSIPLFEAELAAFARAVGAAPTKQIVLVLDRAGWHTSVRLRVPSPRPFALSTAILAPIAAGRAPVAADQYRAHQSAFRHHRRVGGGTTRSLGAVAATASVDPLDNMFSVVAAADPQTTRTQKEIVRGVEL